MKLFKYILAFLLSGFVVCLIQKYVGGNSNKEIFLNIFELIIVEPLLIWLILTIYSNRQHLSNDEKKRFSFTESELIEKYSLEKPLITNDGIELGAVELHRPSTITPLEAVKTSLVDGFFRAPLQIELLQSEILGINTNSKLFNKLTFRLRDIKTTEEAGLEMEFCYSDYYNHMITNNSPDYLLNNISIRDLTEPGPHFCNLLNSRCSNHLGISIMLETSDNKFILQKRNKDVSVFKETFGPSASGALSSDIALDNGIISLEKALKSEISEELFIEENLSIYYLGTTREFKRAGKPESFFYGKLNSTMDEVNHKFLSNLSNEATYIIGIEKEEMLGRIGQYSDPLKASYYFLETHGLV